MAEPLQSQLALWQSDPNQASWESEGLLKYQKRWEDVIDETGLGVDFWDPIMRLDARRMRFGGGESMPKSQIYAAARAIKGKPIVKDPIPSFKSRILDEARAVGRAFLPQNLVPGLAKEAISAASFLTGHWNPELEQMPVKEAWANAFTGAPKVPDISEIPILRWVPGWSTGAKLLTGRGKEVAEHPLFTLMDIAPLGKYGFRGARPALEGVEISSKAIRGAIERTPVLRGAAELGAPEKLMLVGKKGGAEGLLERMGRAPGRLVGMGTHFGEGARDYNVETRRMTKAVNEMITGRGGFDEARKLLPEHWQAKLDTDEGLKKEMYQRLTLAQERLAEIASDPKKRFAEIRKDPELGEWFAWAERKNLELTEQLMRQAGKDKPYVVIRDQATAKMGDAMRAARLGGTLREVAPMAVGELYNVGRSESLTRAFRAYDNYVDELAQKPSWTGDELVELAKRRDSLVDRVSKVAPERYDPLIRSMVAYKTKRKLTNYEMGDPAEAAKALDEANATWMDLKARGANPLYVTQLSPERAERWLRPSPRALLSEKTYAPSVARPRLQWLGTPIVEDAELGIKEFGVQVLRQHHNREVVKQFTSRFAPMIPDPEMPDGFRQATYRDLMQRYLPQVGDDEIKAHQMITKQWALWNPESGMHPIAQAIAGPPAALEKHFASLEARGIAQVLLPKDVASFLDKLRPDYVKDVLPFRLHAPMKLWRTSVLALRPAWTVNNIVGGMVVLLTRTGPGVFKHFGEAWRMARDPDAWPELIAKHNIVHDLGPGYLDNRANFAKGRTLGRIVSKIPEAAYRWNELWDNFYRANAYLYGESKFGKDMGIKLSQKILQDWDAMTPVERQIIRHVFPFWGWQKHILRYVMTYPMDHPLRTAYLGHLGKVVLETEDPTQSDQFNSMFLLGSPGRWFGGKVGAITIGGSNPFNDVFDIFTLSGLVSQMHPVVGSGLEALGVDARVARSDLYPAIDYDPERGTLIAKQPGLLGALEVFPQVSALAAVVKLTPESRELAKRDPEAFAASLQSRLGIPFGLQIHPTAALPGGEPLVTPRTVRPAERVTRTTTARLKGLTAAFSAAKKEGSVTPLRKWYGPRAEEVYDYWTQRMYEAQLADEEAPSIGEIIFEIANGALGEKVVAGA